MSEDVKHQRAIEAALACVNGALDTYWVSDADMRRAVAAFNRALAADLVSGSFGVGEATYAAKLEHTADELDRGDG